MSPKSAIASALQFLCIFAFFLGGLFFICLPYLPQIRVRIIELLTENPEKCTHLGIGFLIATLFLTLSFYALNKGRYIVIKMGEKKMPTSTNIRVIRKAVENCFDSQFPKKIRLKDLELGPKAHLDFKITLEPLDEAAREDLYIEVEEELNTLLKERFGYSKPFNLIVKQ